MDITGITEALADASRVRDVRGLATAYFGERGVEGMSYGHIPPAGAPDGNQIRVATQGFPEAWVKRYVSEKLYLIDPITIFAKQATEPFFWKDIANLTAISPSEQRYLDILDEVDLGDGLGLQVFGPYGRNGYCGLGFAARTARPSSLEIREYQWVCQLAHLRYCDILTSRLDKAPVLTARETEVLRWVAHGKSNGVIAEISRRVSAYRRCVPETDFPEARRRRPDQRRDPRNGRRARPHRDLSARLHLDALRKRNGGPRMARRSTVAAVGLAQAAARCA